MGEEHQEQHKYVPQRLLQELWGQQNQYVGQNKSHDNKVGGMILRRSVLSEKYIDQSVLWVSFLLIFSISEVVCDQFQQGMVKCMINFPATIGGQESSL